jgi:hypothetical protein
MANIEMSRGRCLRIAGPYERLEYRLLVKVAFVLCLGLVAAKRLTARRDEAGHGSIFAEARSAAHAAIGYAYQA